MGLLAYNTPWNVPTIIAIRLPRFSQKTSNAWIVHIIVAYHLSNCRELAIQFYFGKGGLCNDLFVGAFSFFFL